MKRLIVENVSFAYDGRPVLHDIAFDCAGPAAIAVIGANGGGKSTLLKIMAGLLRPLSGQCTLGGRPIQSIAGGVAYLPQSGQVDWNFPVTVEGVVAMGRYPYVGRMARFGEKDREIVRSAMQATSIEQFAGRPISALSGGEKQRMFIARALAQDAGLLILDEPYSELDSRMKRELTLTIRSLIQSGKTVIASHHDLSDLAEIFDYALLLNRSVIGFGRTDEVVTEEGIGRALGVKLGAEK